MDTPNSLDGLLLLASAATTVTEKKKRSRDPLAPTVHELRCSEVSQAAERGWISVQQNVPILATFDTTPSPHR
jgi:hypothetical protein